MLSIVIMKGGHNMVDTNKRTCTTCGNKRSVREMMFEAGQEMCKPCVVEKYERIGVEQKVIDHLRTVSEFMRGPERLERIL